MSWQWGDIPEQYRAWLPGSVETAIRAIPGATATEVEHKETYSDGFGGAFVALVKWTASGANRSAIVKAGPRPEISTEAENAQSLVNAFAPGAQMAVSRLLIPKALDASSRAATVIDAGKHAYFFMPFADAFVGASARQLRKEFPADKHALLALSTDIAETLSTVFWASAIDSGTDAVRACRRFFLEHWPPDMRVVGCGHPRSDPHKVCVAAFEDRSLRDTDITTIARKLDGRCTPEDQPDFSNLLCFATNDYSLLHVDIEGRLPMLRHVDTDAGTCVVFEFGNQLPASSVAALSAQPRSEVAFRGVVDDTRLDRYRRVVDVLGLRLEDDEIAEHLPIRGFKLPNPLWKPGRRLHSLPFRWSSSGHGDLHSGNVFFYQNSGDARKHESLFIDFSHATSAPVQPFLADVARLEISSLAQIVAADLALFVDIQCWLWHAPEGGSTEDCDLPARWPAVARRVSAFVLGLRHAALSQALACVDGDAESLHQQYASVLFGEALRLMKHKAAQHYAAVAAASIAVARLQLAEGLPRAPFPQCPNAIFGEIARGSYVEKAWTALTCEASTRWVVLRPDSDVHGRCGLGCIADAVAARACGESWNVESLHPGLERGGAFKSGLSVRLAEIFGVPEGPWNDGGGRSTSSAFIEGVQADSETKLLIVVYDEDQHVQFERETGTVLLNVLRDLWLRHKWMHVLVASSQEEGEDRGGPDPDRVYSIIVKAALEESERRKLEEKYRGVAVGSTYDELLEQAVLCEVWQEMRREEEAPK